MKTGNRGKADVSERMGTMPPFRLLLSFSLPAVFTMVVSSLYNVVDKIFVGQYVGYAGLAATTVSASAMTAISAVLSLFGTGTGILRALRMGENKTEDLDRLIGNCLLLETLAGLVIAAAGLLFPRPIARLLGGGEVSLELVTRYLSVIFAGAPACCVGTGMTAAIRAEGRPKLAMAITVAGSLLNCALDPLFLAVFGMGIRGAALATVISELLTAALALYFYFFSGRSLVRLTKESFRPDKKLMAEISRLGFPGFIMSVIVSVMAVVMNNTLQYYGDRSAIGGDTAVSSLGLSIAIGDLITMAAIGVQQGTAPLISYNYSAGKYARTRRLFWESLLLLLCVLTAFWAFLEIAPMPLIRLFGDAADEAFAVFTVRVYNLCLPLLAFQVLGGMLLQAIEQTRAATLVSLTRNVIFAIPLLIVLPLFFGARGTIIMGPVADAGGAAVSMWLTAGVLRRMPRADGAEGPPGEGRETTAEAIEL